jgi:hypothetical protein
MLESRIFGPDEDSSRDSGKKNRTYAASLTVRARWGRIRFRDASQEAQYQRHVLDEDIRLSIRFLRIFFLVFAFGAVCFITMNGAFGRLGNDYLEVPHSALRHRAMPPPPPSRPPRARARAPSSTSTITRPPSLPPWDGRFPQRARITRPAKGGPVARTMALALGITAAAHTLAPTPAPPAHRRAASSAPRTSTAASTCGSRSTGRAPSSAASR